jgi:hypothetical protein
MTFSAENEIAVIANQLAAVIKFAYDVASAEPDRIVEFIAASREAKGAMMETVVMASLTAMRDGAKAQEILANTAIEKLEACSRLADEAALAAIVPSKNVAIFDRRANRRKRADGKKHGDAH